MAGQYQNKKTEYKLLLANWVDYSIRNKSWEKHQDLHLDEIDADFIQKEYWLEGSLYAFEIIQSLLKTNIYKCLLVIPLSYSESESNINKLSWSYIKTSFDITPPSFYLFPKGEENYEETLNNLIYLKKLSKDSGYKIFFNQKQERIGEYSRSIYIIKC